MAKLISFPFTFVAETKMGKIYRPYVVIQVFSKAKDGWQNVRFVVDSGADYTLFPKWYAAYLGINLETDCQKEISLGVGGKGKVYQYQNLPVKFGDRKIKIPTGFLENSDLPPLLGRLNCLEKFKLTFDKKTTTFGQT